MEELKVTDLRIGSRIREKKTGFEFIVTSIFWSLYCTPWEFELDEVELVEKGGVR